MVGEGAAVQSLIDWGEQSLIDVGGVGGWGVLELIHQKRIKSKS